MSFGVDPRNPIEYAGIRYFLMPCVNYNREPISGNGGDYDFVLNTVWRVSASLDGTPPISGEEGDEWILIKKTGSYAQANTNPTWQKFTPGSTNNLFTLSDENDDTVSPSSPYDTPPNNIQLYSPNGTVVITADDANHRMGIDIDGGPVDALQQITTDSGIISGTGSPRNVDILGAVVANATNSKPVFSKAIDADTSEIQVQLATTVTPTPLDNLDVGLSCFNENHFQIDADSGMVSLVGSETDSPFRYLSDNTDTDTFPDVDGKIQLIGRAYRSPFAPTSFSTTVSGTSLMRINPMSSSRLIVDGFSNQGGVLYNGTSNSLTQAISQAGLSDTIKLFPSTYNEDVTAVAGTCICAENGNQSPAGAILSGQITIPITGSAPVVFSNVEFSSDTAGACVLIPDTGVRVVIFNNCHFELVSGNGISFTNSDSGSKVILNNCTCNIGGTGITLYDMSSPGELVINGMVINNDGGTTTPMTNSAGIVKLFYVVSKASVGCSGGMINSMQSCQIDTQAINDIAFEAQSGSTCYLYNCVFASGTASAIDIVGGSTVQLTSATVSSSNTNAISGTGTLNKSPVIYTGSSSTIQGTVTVNTFTVA